MSELDDEITSVNAIYNPDTLETFDLEHILKLPARPDITVRLSFPKDYPNAPPSILGTYSTGCAKGEGQKLVDLLRSVLAETFIPGQPCIYDLIQDTEARLQLESTLPDEDDISQEPGQKATIESPQADLTEKDELDVPPSWTVSETVSEKKSKFVARAIHVESVEQAHQYLQHLLTDKRIAKATHNITAWRIQGPNGVQFRDYDDDGETAAGGRLLHLLDNMGMWNMMIVVTRWYGGIHLGADRFRIINQVARDAIIKSGHANIPGKKPKR